MPRSLRFAKHAALFAGREVCRIPFGTQRRKIPIREPKQSEGFYQFVGCFPKSDLALCIVGQVSKPAELIISLTP